MEVGCGSMETVASRRLQPAWRVRSLGDDLEQEEPACEQNLGANEGQHAGRRVDRM